MSELDRFIPAMLAADTLHEHGHELKPSGIKELTLAATGDPTLAEMAWERAAERASERHIED